ERKPQHQPEPSRPDGDTRIDCRSERAGPGAQRYGGAEPGHPDCCRRDAGRGQRRLGRSDADRAGRLGATRVVVRRKRRVYRCVGGAKPVNAWGAALGAKKSIFFTDNTTSSDDLAVLWAAEASGSLGGQAAQSWLYPFLTSTKTESGIPAGVGGQSAVVHKTGTLDEVDNDAALVVSGPNGPYTLTVMTDGLGED